MNAIDAVLVGRLIHHHPDLAPLGTNVNFVQAAGNQALKIRTYERGVEAETLSCGSGTVAAVVIATLRGLVSPRTSLGRRTGHPHLRRGPLMTQFLTSSSDLTVREAAQNLRDWQRDREGLGVALVRRQSRGRGAPRGSSRTRHPLHIPRRRPLVRHGAKPSAMSLEQATRRTDVRPGSAWRMCTCAGCPTGLGPRVAGPFSSLCQKGKPLWARPEPASDAATPKRHRIRWVGPLHQAETADPWINRPLPPLRGRPYGRSCGRSPARRTEGARPP
ncbi:hypothetical protein AB0I69_06445 [Streptomyces sp. NPDC050508]|uniref:hypothetical protein n=1 Tax=Streptomyces sp. NPDC050508 TaxID=3155405 RepID=UPI003415ADE6